MSIVAACCAVVLPLPGSPNWGEWRNRRQAIETACFILFPSVPRCKHLRQPESCCPWLENSLVLLGRGGGRSHMNLPSPTLSERFMMDIG